MIHYLFGSLSYDEIYQFLLDTDAVFQTPLSNRVNLEEYARKLSAFSVFSYCRDEGSIVGLISCYMNHPPEAYISNVCVQSDYQNKGLFKKMLEVLINQLEQTTFTTVRLEVSDYNVLAQIVYKKSGFRSIGRASDNSQFFVLDLIGFNDDES